MEADTVENRVAILMYHTAPDRGSVIEILDESGNVLTTGPFA